MGWDWKEVFKLFCINKKTVVGMERKSACPESYALGLRMDDYREGLESTLQGILGMKPGQRLVVVTSFVPSGAADRVGHDEMRYRRETYTIARFLGAAGKGFGYAVEFIEYPATFQNAMEPPAEVTEQILRCADEDVAMIFMPWDSLTHTPVRMEACRRGARVMSSPHFTAEMMGNGGPMCADYREIRKVSEAVARLIGDAEYERISAPDGTNIEVHFVEGAPAKFDPRDLSVASADRLENYGNFPAGESFRAIEPHPRTGGMIGGYLEGEEVQVEVQEGVAVAVVSEGRASDRLRMAFFGDERAGEEVMKKRRQVGEDGTGTNSLLVQAPKRWMRSTLTAEKIWGTKHIAFGNNRGFGGTNDVQLHEDIIILQPTARLSTGVQYVKGGKLVLPGL